ncbi:pyridoxamine 5'-phosphate oxidase family protein [Actinophytocola sp.]|uniref:pyridoxamine 5'-phosphate oxidase family protein n=1 Tax=Actinophytocola sp. TaxID=1872138 RepID=UPI00389A3F9A
MREHTMDNEPRLEVLDREQCLALLGTLRIGRLFFTEGALPAVQPVNFRVHREQVVIRVAGGAKLGAAAAHSVVAFEADDLDPDLRTGWNVTVVGPAERITDVDELVAVSGIWLRPWVDGRRDHFVRVIADRVTGRRLHPPAATGGGPRRF